MAISEYINSSTGEKLFKVRIKRRSPREAGLAIDKREQGFKTKAEAERAERKLFIQAERELTEVEQKTCLWKNLVDEWEVNARQGDIFIRALSPQTIDDYTYTIRDHCKEWLRLHVDEIDRARAWMVLDRVEREISISRRKRLRTAIDAVFKWGILAGKLKGLTVIPTDGFKSLLKEEEKMPEILNLGQIRALLDYAEKVNHPWYPHWALALFTGMRSGELYALEWDQVDFENKLIYVHKNWTNRTGYGPTKGRYWRAVPIESTQVLELLKELKIKRANDKFVLHHFKVWTDGEQASILREFCIGSGLPSVRFHTLRACFATQLIRDSVAPAVVMKICGWKDLKTMQRYIRLAGIEVKGATQGLKLLPEREVMGRVVSLFRQE
ncbi:MAG: site-specific integrase [Deltaproteobacteria bacterium]|jgi:integrase|nr:site-specific integrase [Deltaproteobacteria bacterium]